MHIVDANFRASTLPQSAAYGFVPYPADKQALYTDAASALFEAVSSGVLPTQDRDWKRHGINLVRLFGSVSSQGDAAWFVNSEMLGHPSPEVAGRMIGVISQLVGAIRGGVRTRFAALAEAFKNDHGDQMLESYLDVNLRGEKPIVEEEWVYVLWSQSQNGILRIGATTGDLRTLVSETNRRVSSAVPTGILAAWPVHDADEAKVTVANTLRHYKAGESHYFIKPGDAKSLLESALKATDNFVLSPFHVDDEKPMATQKIAMRA
jgi:hypothetical protein